MPNSNELRVNPIQVWNDNLSIERLKDGGVRLAVGFGGMKTEEWLESGEAALLRITLAAGRGDIKASCNNGAVLVTKGSAGEGTITLLRPKYSVTANLSADEVAVVVSELTAWSRKDD